MVNENENENEKIEEEILGEEKLENKIEKPNVPPVTKYTRPPAFVKGNNQFRGNQNNFTKQVQRKASGRGR